MSGFTPLVKYTTFFEKDEVSMQIRNLKRSAMMTLTPHMDDKGKMKLGNVEMLNLAADMLPAHVEDFKGLKDIDGNELTFEQVLDQAYFIELLGDIIGKLFDISRLGDKDAKNSQGQLSTLPVAQGRSGAKRSRGKRAKTG